MKKYIFSLILVATIFSCRKENAEGEKKDYTYFLSETGQTFTGKLDGAYFSWSYGWNQFQSMAGYENGNGVCDSTDPVRVLLFGLTSEDGGNTRFTIYTPRYNATSEAEFLRVFGVGKKKLGDFRSDFYLQIQKDRKFYHTVSNSNNEIEILQTHEFIDDFQVRKLRVWFRIEARLTGCNCGEDNLKLSDGLMVAEFFGYRKGGK